MRISIELNPLPLLLEETGPTESNRTKVGIYWQMRRKK